ncbi:MAG: hypothetical protein CVV64_11950, partial [Candidatus Wallbacteria bacterium HGW-Wallbacteria-1]
FVPEQPIAAPALCALVKTRGGPAVLAGGIWQALTQAYRTRYFPGQEGPVATRSDSNRQGGR